LYTFEEEDQLFCRKLAFDMKKSTKNLLFNTKTRLKHTFCEILRNNSLFGKKNTFRLGRVTKGHNSISSWCNATKAGVSCPHIQVLIPVK